MATPHVAGAFALLRECVDGNGVPQTNAAAAADLDATGVDVTRNGVTRKRINVLDAATRNVNNNDFANAEVLAAGNGPFNDFDFTVCSDTEPGEPGPFSIDNGVWWTWTARDAPARRRSPPRTTASNVTDVRHDAGGLHRQLAGPSLQTVAFDDDSGTGNRSSVDVPGQRRYDVPDQGRRLRRGQRPAQPAHRERPAADLRGRRGDHRRAPRATT